MIWNEEIEEYKLANLTKEDIATAEQILQIKLPESYINIMFEQNGGVPYHQAFPCNVPNSWADDHVPVQGIFGIGEEGILQSHYLIQEWDLPENIIIFSGVGHGWLAMDYRQRTSEPPIIWIDTEQNIIIEIANDFSSFIEGLFTVSNEEVEIEKDNAKPFSIDNIERLFEQEDGDHWIMAFNMLYEHTAGHEIYIEQKMIQLLNGQIEELKQFVVHYTMIYNERFSFSQSSMQTIYNIMEQDPTLSGEIKSIKDYLKQLKKFRKRL